MIDLTPLDVRKKRGDFRRILRGYDPEEVDHFLELVAERMEVLVRENFSFSERISRLQEQVGSLEGREKAVHEALVTAEKLRSDVKEQARREADAILREAEIEARRRREDGERDLGEQEAALVALERERRQFLLGFRSMLERQMERLEAEEAALGVPEGPAPPPRRSPRSAGQRAARRGRGGGADETGSSVPVIPVAPVVADEAGEEPALVETVEVPEVEVEERPAEELAAGSGATDPAPGDEIVERPRSGEEGDVGEGGVVGLLEAGTGPEADHEGVSAAPSGSGDERASREEKADVEDLSRWLASFLEDEGGAGR
jgi:cell division initiation protein